MTAPPPTSFYSTYTTQLSSKKYGMEVEGTNLATTPKCTTSS